MSLLENINGNMREYFQEISLGLKNNFLPHVFQPLQILRDLPSDFDQCTNLPKL